RYQAGGLPAPWGNIHCMYSIALTQESNPDLDGLFLLYRPSLDAYGDYNSPGASYSIIPNNTYITPAFTITDCNGDRLVFDQSLRPYNDVHSTLVPYNGGYQLQNAGPPGRLKEAGFFTYTFSAPSGAPATSQLLSIGDVFGNQQTLSYGGSPYLTVTDSSSGRELLFYTGTGGYLSSVDAPAGGGGVNTHTTTTMDSGGHLTALNVYAGGSDTAIHTDTWEYGGPNGDSVISSTEGLSQAAFNYVGDSYNIDPFALQTPRLSSASYGSAYDGSSSDNGGSVQGTVNYTYGPVKSGYDDWSPASRTNTITDARGNLTSQLFTLTNDISDSIKSIQTTGPDYAGAPAKSNISTINYSPDIINPSLISGTDPLGHVWTETLNENQTISQATDPLDDAWNFGYSPSDSRLLTSITDPTNLTWNFHYGENGNALSDLTSILDPAGVTQATINYNSFGQPINSTIPAAVSAFGTAEEAQLAYNATTGDVTSSTNPAGDDATLDSYDPLGDLLQTSLYPDTGNPNTSTAPLRLNLTWDGGQELTGATLPNGVQVNNAWNNQAATEVQTKAPVESGGATLAQMDFSYDTRGRLYSASDLVGVCEQFRYDRNSAITKVLDGNSNATTLSRGANDELTAVTWPDGVHHTSLSYDAAGREVSATDERGNVCNLVADNANRLTTIEIPSDTAENIGFTYDNASRLLSATDSTGSTSFNYDPTLKHLTSVGTTLSALPAGSNSFTTSYTYYPDGRRKTMSLTVGADVYTWSYTWDGVGRLSSITSPFSEGASWSYDHAGRLTGQTTTTASGAQLQTQYVYGVSGQGGDSSTAPYYLRNMYELVNGTAFWSYTLTHSYLGQLTGQSGSGSAGETENESYGFDPRGRLTSDSEQYTVDAQHNHANSGSFGYDLANNLNGEAGGWSYNTDDQVTATNSGLGGLPAATGLSYDASGNLTGLSGYSLSYDVWGELSGFGSVTFTYDSAGRRVSKTAGGVRTYYLYDGDNLIAELNGLGQVQTIYTWGAAGLISDRIGLNGTPQSRFYEFDATGSTRALLDQNGTGLSRGAYTAWGSTYAYTPSTPFAWLGQLGNYTDQETGLVLMQARYYAPSLGRFVSADPTGFNGGINLYAYCGDDPINYFDPLGLWQTGSHAGDSWEVLKGEGSALNPVNAWNGLKGMWAYGWSHDYFDNAACIDIFKVIGHSMEFWNQPDLHSMGSSFMGDELMVAPLIKKVPFGGLTKAVPVLEEATAPAAAAEEVMSDADAAGEAARCGGPVYMRAVGDDEAAAIKSGVIPESKTSPFPEESATRVFPPGVVDRMMPFFDQKNAEVPGTYTKMVTFKLGREIPTAIDSSTFPTYYVNVDDLAGALRADPIIEALEAHK
ncbi:MAG TPA: RHS repeat-associated core domain-containing protein, partial [Armatimonadota bacterium]|nr:RHS repeat-associated core domain-containing protein [Armatimonadota bacterium]